MKPMHLGPKWSFSKKSLHMKMFLNMLKTKMWGHPSKLNNYTSTLDYKGYTKNNFDFKVFGYVIFHGDVFDPCAPCRKNNSCVAQYGFCLLATNAYLVGHPYNSGWKHITSSPFWILFRSNIIYIPPKIWCI